MTDTVSIALSNDEALVLFEWLAERADADIASHAGSEAPLGAEEIVLARLQGQLETALIEPFDPAYKNLVAAARLRVRQSP